MSVPPAVSIDEICKRGSITAEDVSRMRRLLFTDAAITEDEAATLFELNRACRVQDHTWRDFFIEAVSDFLINDVEPHGYLTQRNAAWLIEQIAPGGSVATKGEIELLVALIDKARWSPESLVRFTLEQILHAVTAADGPLRAGTAIPAGEIGENEVELVRRIVYAFGGEGSIAVTRAEAEVLFQINDAIASGAPNPQWSEFFVKAIANCIMAASGYAVPTREEALRREAWLESSGDITVASFLSALKPGLIGRLYTLQSSEERALARLERQRIEIITNEEVTQGEVDWLEAQLGRDGRLTDNERLLIAYIERESPVIHPALETVVSRLADAA